MIYQTFFPFYIFSQKVMGGNSEDSSSHERMVGWKADQYRGILKLRYPMQNGVIEDWDAMIDVRKFLLNIFKKKDSTTSHLLITGLVINFP